MLRRYVGEIPLLIRTQGGGDGAPSGAEIVATLMYAGGLVKFGTITSSFDALARSGSLTVDIQLTKEGDTA